MRIATHNSATGEAGHGIISWLATPFARCQSKTIQEQLESGCRYFDIRVRNTGRGWIGAHGIWESKRSIKSILSEINLHGRCYVNITYEGESTDDFIDKVKEWITAYKNITFCEINEKKPRWHNIATINNVPRKDNFLHLEFSTWHTLIPIPWIWKKIYYGNPTFNDEKFTFVDFL